MGIAQFCGYCNCRMGTGRGLASPEVKLFPSHAQTRDAGVDLETQANGTKADVARGGSNSLPGWG
jgi:hypothetical protein